MKKQTILKFMLTAVLLLCVFPVLGQTEETGISADTTAAAWPHDGYYMDENDNFLSVTYFTDDAGNEGWWVGAILGEDMYGNYAQLEGDTLSGDIVPDYEEGEFYVTVAEEGEGRLVLTTAEGEVYHFTPMEMEEATIFVSFDTEGLGDFLYAEGESTDWIDDGFTFSFAQFNINEPETYTFKAQAWDGCNFIKWTKDGMDYSTEEQITVVLDESANYTAVFDWGLPFEDEGINYLVLVNKLNPLPEGWEDALETVHMTNSLGDDVEVETFAYEAYLRLKDDLAEEGVYVDLDSAYRSVAVQQEIMDRFTAEYGADYAAKTVAVPGYSEHHTGLALDLYLNINGEDVYYNEDMIQYPEIWAKIHEKLDDYGFILRYLEGKEHITGYGYEPWHIRYVADPDAAHYIMDNGLTLEGYLGAVNETVVDVDYGVSELFTPEDLEEAAVQIKCKFASWEGCELHTLRYAGDENSTAENLAWLNSHGDYNYTQCAEFKSDFHSPAEGFSAFEPDYEYTDWNWWLARTDESGWEIIDWGY